MKKAQVFRPALLLGGIGFVDVASGSVASVQGMVARSVKQRQCHKRSMTAAPSSAAIPASAVRPAQRQLHGSRREYEWQDPPTAHAADRSFAMEGYGITATCHLVKR